MIFDEAADRGTQAHAKSASDAVANMHCRVGGVLEGGMIMDIGGGLERHCCGNNQGSVFQMGITGPSL